jgi:UDP-glucose 4-epimerase
MTPLILVTGGAGFIGGHLVDGLLRDGARVRVLDDFSTGSREVAAAWGTRVEVSEGDLRDAEVVRRAADGAKTIVHLAAISSVERSIHEPEHVHEVNTTGTLHVLQAAKTNGAKVVFSSSAAVYGDLAEEAAREDSPCRPLSPYGAQKLLAEHYLRVYKQLYALDGVALRFFNVYGPRQRKGDPYGGVIRAFLGSALAGRPLSIHGDGLQTRDFIYVGDVVDALMLAITSPTQAYGALNVGTGHSLTVQHLASAVVEAARSLSPIEYGPGRPGDVRHSLCDTSRCRQALGFEARTSLEQGLALTVEALTQSATH